MVINQDLYQEILNDITKSPNKDSIYYQAVQDRLVLLSEQYSIQINQTFDKIRRFLKNDRRFKKEPTRSILFVSKSLKKAINYHNRLSCYSYKVFQTLCTFYIKL